MLSVVAVGLLFAHATATGQEVTSECPGDGFFADATQCDKYYSCSGGVLTEKLCSDGFVFNDVNPALEKCDFPFQVSCEGRPQLQTPRPTPNCPRQNGYFPSTHKNECKNFYYCAAGQGSRLTCPETLVFSLKTGTCAYPGPASRSDCKAEKLFNFTCPAVSDQIAVAHPRYADPDDCQYFYVCINGIEPRRSGCSFGDVYNSKTEACDKPLDVPECKDYYASYFENHFASLIREGRPATQDILDAAEASAYPVPSIPRKVKIDLAGVPQSARKRQPVEKIITKQPLALLEPEVKAEAQIPPQPVRPTRRKPGRRPSLSNRRRPVRRRKTTTTTTTAAPLEEEYYDYYYDEPAVNQPVANQPATTA